MSAPNWLTPAGLIGIYPAQISFEYQLEAIPVLPALTVSYKLLSGSLPLGISLRIDGLIYGTPALVTDDTTSTFVIRATDNLGNIKDRTFELSVSGDAVPAFTTAEGAITTVFDSEWVEIPITYSNPVADNPVTIRVLQGALPPGLEINEYGLIRGYPEPPITLVNLPELTTTAVSTDSTNNYITVLGTNGFRPNRAIVFSGPSFGGLVTGQVYYIKSIINATQITITTIPNGEVFFVTTDNGLMDVTLPLTQVGQPSKRQYSFTLALTSPLGNDTAFYSLTVINQNLPLNQGGPGLLPGTRNPTIYNTRPPTYNIEKTQYFGYYVLPPTDEVAIPGTTYAPTAEAYMGQFLYDNYFSFQIIGHDFDNDDITYQFQNLPGWLTGNTSTGWIYGTPSGIPANDIEEFSFQVKVVKTSNSTYSSPLFNFNMQVANDITGQVVWITGNDLGDIDNATLSNKKVEATSDVVLSYRILSGDLPPNLTFRSNGDIDGIVAYQPSDVFLEKDTRTTYTFTVEAYNEDIPLVSSTKTFTLTVVQTYDIPTDNLYIKCTPSFRDRDIIASLLNDPILIPDEYLYRIQDPNYGKASNVVYAHAYGIYSSDFEEYLEAVKKNHYWRNITLGELKTAVAKNEQGEVIYEVVYSTVIDNLQKYDPNYNYDYRYSQSVSEEIFWPRFIDLNLGPWYASSTEIYTSYIFPQETQLLTNYTSYDVLTQTGLPLITQQGTPTFYTSLTPGYARILYPNSLENMRKRIEQELGANYNFRLLPLWMTSQQNDGNTLGFTPAWVIAYTKLPEPIALVATATNELTNTIQLSSVTDLVEGGEIVFSGNTFGGIKPRTKYYVASVNSLTNRIQVSLTQYGDVLSLETGSGTMPCVFDAISYAQVIKRRIETDWDHTLNQINFQIDRFTVGKTLTYNYDTKLDPKVWTRYPSATPEPDPSDSEDFYVLFPQKTILPTKTQYNL